MYVIVVPEHQEVLPPWESGWMEFKNPLVLAFNHPVPRGISPSSVFGYDDKSWKARLKKTFGATGKELSNFLLSSGYDGIITAVGDDVREVVSLRQGFRENPAGAFVSGEYWYVDGELIECDDHEKGANEIINARELWEVGDAVEFLLKEGAVRVYDGVRMAQGRERMIPVTGLDVWKLDRDTLGVLQGILLNLQRTGDHQVDIDITSTFSEGSMDKEKLEVTAQDVLEARTPRELRAAGTVVRENSWGDYISGEYWYYDGQLTPADSSAGLGHEEVAMNFILDEDTVRMAIVEAYRSTRSAAPRWMKDIQTMDAAEMVAHFQSNELPKDVARKAWSDIMGTYHEPWVRMERPFSEEMLRRGAVRVVSSHIQLGKATRDSLLAAQDAVMQAAGEDAETSGVILVNTEDDDALWEIGVDEFLSAKSWRDVRQGSVRRNPSYLDLVKKDVKESYGSATTENTNQAGFLLADGTWLNMGMYGERGNDHRFVTGFVRGKWLKEVHQGDRWGALVHWMKVTGSIRWMPENCSFDIHVKPTKEQLNQIWKMARMCEETTIEQTRGKKQSILIYTPAERDFMVEQIRDFWR